MKAGTPKTPASAAAAKPAGNHETPASVSPPLDLTFESVIHDVASWWCYTILKRGDLRLFDELDEILDSVPGPFPASSPLSIRLRLLVPWQELLKQLYTPGCTVGQKQFEGIQDKLLLLHQGFFSKTSAAEEFNSVLRMVQTHSVLSKLYDYFSKIEGLSDEQQLSTNEVLDQSSADWESIYLESDGVPPSLLDLVDKTNGWDHEDRRDHILQIVSFPDSALTYRRLKKKMQSLLLFWFENEIIDTDSEDSEVSELLRMRYRGFGYAAAEIVHKDAAKNTATPPNTPAASKIDPSRPQEETSVVVASRLASPAAKEPEKAEEKQQEQQRPIITRQDTFASESSDWSDSDDEKVPPLKMNRDEKQTRLSMPVGEPSYSEASPSQRKMSSHRKRRRLGDQYHHHRSSTHSKSTGRKLKYKHGFSDSSDSDNSVSSDFNDSDDEGTAWTQEQDAALKNGIHWNGYGNWDIILKQEKRLLGTKGKKDLQDRANMLLSNR